MKNLIISGLTVVLLACATNATAQNRKQKPTNKKHSHTTQHVTKHPQYNSHHSPNPHLHYSKLPKRGVVVNSMHTNANIYNHGGISFHYHAGVWYKPQGSQWVTVRPANGIRINVLPTGYRRIAMGPKVYYYYYGTYYIQKNNQYEVVDAPMNAAINSLPDGYHSVTVDGIDYYELDGVYYMPSLDINGQEVLVVVANPIN